MRLYATFQIAVIRIDVVFVNILPFAYVYYDRIAG